MLVTFWEHRYVSVIPNCTQLNFHPCEAGFFRATGRHITGLDIDLITHKGDY